MTEVWIETLLNVLMLECEGLLSLEARLYRHQEGVHLGHAILRHQTDIRHLVLTHSSHHWEVDLILGGQKVTSVSVLKLMRLEMRLEVRHKLRIVQCPRIELGNSVLSNILRNQDWIYLQRSICFVFNYVLQMWKVLLQDRNQFLF